MIGFLDTPHRRDCIKSHRVQKPLQTVGKKIRNILLHLPLFLELSFAFTGAEERLPLLHFHLLFAVFLTGYECIVTI